MPSHNFVVLWISRSMFETWLFELFFLGSPKNVNGYQQIIGRGNNKNAEITCDGLVSYPGGIEILLLLSGQIKVKPQPFHET